MKIIKHDDKQVIDMYDELIKIPGLKPLVKLNEFISLDTWIIIHIDFTDDKKYIDDLIIECHEDGYNLKDYIFGDKLTYLDILENHDCNKRYSLIETIEKIKYLYDNKIFKLLEFDEFEEAVEYYKYLVI